MTTQAECKRARDWRERQKWSVRELAERTGFSTAAIYKFEQGFVSYQGANKRIDKSAWQRFKTACAGADFQRRGRIFEW